MKSLFAIRPQRAGSHPELQEPTDFATDRTLVPTYRPGGSPEERERKEIAFGEGKKPTGKTGHWP
jgi:hypothetical protein